ncbi:MAG: hypothetical protein AAB393_09230 [Bacteroidota bacterium]
MKKSSQKMRHLILTRLYAHLEEHYSISLADDFPFDEEFTLHHIDAILAFRSDPQLDELRAALDRLEDGTFGVCISCKNSVDETSMDADPTRRFCERCEHMYSHVVLNYEGFPLPV